jgi:16S rRNA (cytidine1402-2'-O)-methyltransferase
MKPRELNFEGTSPLLYLIATPIGNLSEMTPRALEVLKATDYIAAEDTRNSGQLMAHFAIDKPFISCHEHNEEAASEKIVALLQQGKKVCYMSDAGYPTLSDPGERLVAKCLENGIKVSVTSGPSAAIDALAVSGLPSDHFYFEGFLPAKASERDVELLALSSRLETIIFYESPHRIKDTLTALARVLGPRQAIIARELTKAHEEIIRGSLDEFVSLGEETLRGEMVILVSGATPKASELSENDITSLLKSKIKAGKSSKDAIGEIAKENGLPKNAVYQIYLKNVK